MNPRCRHLAHDANPYLRVPLMAQGQVLGIIHLSSASDSSAQTGPALDLAQTVADRVGLAVANLKLGESLRLQSVRDPLTGTYNRRFMEEVLAREVSRMARVKSPLVSPCSTLTTSRR